LGQFCVERVVKASESKAGHLDLAVKSSHKTSDFRS
jgi:hypothetical protein